MTNYQLARVIKYTDRNPEEGWSPPLELFNTYWKPFSLFISGEI